MSMLKVLMLINGNPFDANGGLGVHVRHLCDKLRKYEDIELTVVSADYCSQNGGFFLVGDKKVRVERKDFVHTPDNFRLLEVYNTNGLLTKIGFLQKVITDDIFLENALCFFGREKFDLIHVHDANLWGVARHLRALYKCPVVLSCHLNLYLSHERMPENPFYIYDIQQEISAMDAASKLIAVSEYYRKAIGKEFWLEEKIEVIHNGVDYDFLQTVGHDGELRKSYGEKPLVVFTGRLVPTKGVWLILDAIKKLPEYYFVLIASLSPTLEPSNPIVEEMERMKKTCKNFEWHNFLEQDKKWAIMKIADLAIMPSIHEPFGITALEWFGLGVPLIVSDTGGLSEFCNSGNADIIEPAAETLIAAIKSHARDEDKISNAKSTAKAYTWGKAAEKTREVYLSLTKKP